MTKHLPAETILSLARGDLRGQAARAARAHVDECALCDSELAREEEAISPPPPVDRAFIAAFLLRVAEAQRKQAESGRAESNSAPDDYDEPLNPASTPADILRGMDALSDPAGAFRKDQTENIPKIWAALPDPRRPLRTASISGHLADALRRHPLARQGGDHATHVAAATPRFGTSVTLRGGSSHFDQSVAETTPNAALARQAGASSDATGLSPSGEPDIVVHLGDTVLLISIKSNDGFLLMDARAQTGEPAIPVGGVVIRLQRTDGTGIENLADMKTSRTGIASLSLAWPPKGVMEPRSLRIKIKGGQYVFAVDVDLDP